MSLGFCGNQLAHEKGRSETQTPNVVRSASNFQHILSVDFSIKSEKHPFFVLDLQGAWSSDIFNFIGNHYMIINMMVSDYYMMILYDGILYGYDSIIIKLLLLVYFTSFMGNIVEPSHRTIHYMMVQ